MQEADAAAAEMDKGLAQLGRAEVQQGAAAQAGTEAHRPPAGAPSAQVAEKPNPGTGGRCCCMCWERAEREKYLAVVGQPGWPLTFSSRIKERQGWQQRRRTCNAHINWPWPQRSAGSSRVGARRGATALVDPQTEAELAAAGLPGA